MITFPTYESPAVFSESLTGDRAPHFLSAGTEFTGVGPACPAANTEFYPGDEQERRPGWDETAETRTPANLIQRRNKSKDHLHSIQLLQGLRPGSQVPNATD